MGRILFWVGLAVIIYAVIVIGRKRRSAEEKALRREARREAQAAASTHRAGISNRFMRFWSLGFLSGYGF